MNIQRNIFRWVGIILIIVVAIAGVYLYGNFRTERGNGNLEQILQNQPKPAIQTPPSSVLKTYRSVSLGFQLTYPKYGEIQDPSCFEAGGKCGPSSIGECGNAIVEKNNQVIIDNLFGISRISWSGTIVDYIKQKDPTGITYYSSISVPRADEAVEITGYDTNKQKEGYPPFAYVNYILRKGNFLFTFAGVQDPGSAKGCIPFDEHGKSINWDVTKNFQFF